MSAFQINSINLILRTMNTKRIVMLTMLLAIISMVTISAQGQRGNATPEERAARMTQRMKTSLSLTDDQVAKVQALNLQLAKDQVAAREKGGDFRTEFQAIQQKYADKLKEILTADQLKTYQESRKQMQTRFNGSGGGNTPN